MKRYLLLLTAFAAVTTLQAQTLFTYGPDRVDKSEFERAFLKNNPSGERSEKALREYLDLFVNFKLKVRAARDLRLDTLPNQRADLANFRSQIEGNFLSDRRVIEELAREALLRSRTEIRVHHILIEAPVNASVTFTDHTAQLSKDTGAAARKAQEAYRRLQAGASFMETARAYSDDLSSKTNGGDLGYISVFALPYELESLVYSLPLGKHSGVYRSSKAYHIVYKQAERPSQGNIHLAQLLIAVDPQATPAQQAQKRKLSDSLYQALRKGASFSKLAQEFSDDRMSYANGGILPPFRPGTYDAAFEQKAVVLKEGDIAPPFQTGFGFHIIKKLPTQTADTAQEFSNIMQEVMNDARTSLARRRFEEKVNKLVGAKKGQQDAMRYYIANMEEYDPEFKYQLEEFREGNLLFEVMEREIWTKANNDSVGLRNYYNEHRNEYKWGPSAAAIFYSFSNAKMGEKIRAEVTKGAGNWKRFTEAGTGEALADSGRFELAQIPALPVEVKAGYVTPVVINPQDSSGSFLQILKVYPQAEPKTYEEAKGAVINDYQLLLEKKWLDKLRRKYPVKVNDAVLKSLAR